MHIAARNDSVLALRKICGCAEAVTATLTYNLLLSKNKDSTTVCRLAAEGGHIKAVEELWDLTWNVELSLVRWSMIYS